MRASKTEQITDKVKNRTGLTNQSRLIEIQLNQSALRVEHERKRKDRKNELISYRK